MYGMQRANWLQKNLSGYATTLPYEASAEAFSLGVIKGRNALPEGLRNWFDTWANAAREGPPKRLKEKSE